MQISPLNNKHKQVTKGTFSRRHRCTDNILATVGIIMSITTLGAYKIKGSIPLQLNDDIIKKSDSLVHLLRALGGELKLPYTVIDKAR